MRWWWEADPQTPVLHASDPIPDPMPTPSEPPASPREIADKPKLITSRNETVEQQLSQFLPIFAESENERRDTLKPHSDQKQDSSSCNEEERDGTFRVPYPETMSCREAFDSAYHCQSLGGQFTNVYRYGTYRQCKDHWAQFWFCMRNRQKPEEVKRELIRDFYKQKETQYADGPSSEDIWEQRTERVEKAFHLDLDEVELIDSRRKGQS